MISITGIVCIVCAAMLLISLILPFASMKREYAREFMSEPDYELEDGLTARQVVRISLLEFTRITKYLPVDEEARTIITVAFIILAVLGALALLFAILKKPVGIIIFDILYVIPAIVFSTAFKKGDMVNEDMYRTGMGQVCIYLFAALLLIAAIVLIVFKSQAKKEANKIEEVPVF